MESAKKIRPFAASAKKLRQLFVAVSILAVWAPLASSRAGADTPTAVLPAEKFGVVGDGKTDDGPGVLRLLAAATHIAGPVELRFAPDRTYFLASGRERYAFRLDAVNNFTLDGGGSIFLIESQLRFLKLTHSSNVSVRNFKVDYVPLPFADGVVIGKSKTKGWLDVKIDAGLDLPPLGGPTRQDGEQLFFGVLWHPGAYSTLENSYLTRDHCVIADIREAVPGSLKQRIVRVMASEKNSGLFDRVEVGQWRMSIPVRGIAHRFGPGESCVIAHNENVTFENVEMWAAPWFAFGVADNDGNLVFRNVNVRPKPGTSRQTSSWRDGFHVKNNPASLLWEDCTLQGVNDDAFNLACHASRVREVKSPTHIFIQQNYPRGIARLRPGDTLVAYNQTRGVPLGRAKIASVHEASPGADAPGVARRAPVFEIELAQPLATLEPGKTVIWNETTANPHNVIRNCRVDISCRFRSPVTIENSQINGLSWFTGDAIEAPLPRDVVVRNCVLRLGQGNPNLVVGLDGPSFHGQEPTAPVIFNVLFESNKIFGDVWLRDAAHVVLRGNDFADPKRTLSLHNVQDVQLRDNRRGGTLITDLTNLVTDPNDAAQITIANHQN